MEINILWTVFGWTFKQQLSLLLFLSDWYCRKFEFTDLTGHGRKVTSDKNMISVSHQGYKSENRDYFSHFSVTFETTVKFLIVFVRLILGNVGVDVFTGSRRKSDVR